MGMLYNTQRACRFGFEEGVDQYQLYAEGYEDDWAFWDTFAFNFGLIYDSILTAMQSFDDEKFFMAGYSVGKTLYYLFFQL